MRTGGSTTKDNGIFILIGMIIGALIVTNLYFIFNKPQEPIVFEIPKLKKEFPIDAGDFIVGPKHDTIFIDTTTHLMDLPLRNVVRECSNSIFIDSKKYYQSITVEAIGLRGLLSQLKIEADPLHIETTPKKKLDWKIPVIAFLGGIILDRMVLKN